MYMLWFRFHLTIDLYLIKFYALGSNCRKKYSMSKNMTESLIMIFQLCLLTSFGTFLNDKYICAF